MLKWIGRFLLCLCPSTLMIGLMVARLRKRLLVSVVLVLITTKSKAEKDLSKRNKRRQGCCSCCENCTSIGWCLAKLRAFRTSEQTSEQREVSVKPDAESLERNSKGTIHKVYATSSEYPGKERTIVGKSKCQSSSSAKSQRYEI